MAEYLLLKQQLVVIKRKKHRSPNLTKTDRLIFAITSLFIKSSRLPKLSIVIAHSTLLRLHKALVNRKYSQLFSNKKIKKPGPKGPSQALIKLILEIKEKNPSYGCPKIALLTSQLQNIKIDEQMVRRILRKYFFLPSGSGPSWLNVIGHTKDALWSMDLFCCESIILQTNWVMVVIDHYTREIIGTASMRGNPNGANICQMFASIKQGSGRTPKYLSTDHDPLFRYNQWLANLSIMDIEQVKSVPEIPWSHPFIERVIGTIRREYLDKIFFWNEHDLTKKLREFMNYYNEARVHSSLAGKTPLGMSENGRITKINLQNHMWKSYCNSLFSIPIAA